MGAKYEGVTQQDGYSKEKNSNTMNKLDPNWIETQHRSFLNWTNSKLKEKNVRLTDLSQDLHDGVNLIYLVEALTGKQIPIPCLNPEYRIQMMNNITEALTIIKQCGVNLLNIDSNDIVEGNLKLTLALIHSLIYRFQITPMILEASGSQPMTVNSGESFVEKQLIQWLNSILYNNQQVINNLESDWCDGEHLKNLVSHFTNFDTSNWSTMDPVSRIASCLDVAENQLGIPKIQEAADMVSRPDKFSMLAFLSYFRMAKKDQPPITTVQTPQSPIEQVIQTQPPLVVQPPPSPIEQSQLQQPIVVQPPPSPMEQPITVQPPQPVFVSKPQPPVFITQPSVVPVSSAPPQEHHPITQPMPQQPMQQQPMPQQPMQYMTQQQSMSQQPMTQSPIVQPPIEQHAHNDHSLSIYQPYATTPSPTAYDTNNPFILGMQPSAQHAYLPSSSTSPMPSPMMMHSQQQFNTVSSPMPSPMMMQQHHVMDSSYYMVNQQQVPMQYGATTTTIEYHQDGTVVRHDQHHQPTGYFNPYGYY